MRRALHAGFTGIVSAGVVNDNIDAELALAIEEGVVPGPRLVPGGLALDTTGDYNDTGKYWWRLGNLGAQRFCDGPDEFRKAVREEIKRGVRIIKIFASGGHGVAEDASTRGFATDELRAIVAAAHQRGVPVRAHCAWRDLILECVREGVDIIDHGDAADAECIDAMLEHRTFLCPSLYLVKLLLDYRGDVPIATPAQLEAVRREFDGRLRDGREGERGRRAPARGRRLRRADAAPRQLRRGARVLRQGPRHPAARRAALGDAPRRRGDGARGRARADRARPARRPGRRRGRPELRHRGARRTPRRSTR